MNDVLGNHISGRCLCTENHGNGRCGNFACFDFQILVNDIQGVHLLTLVFMQTLDLGIENAVGI